MLLTYSIAGLWLNNVLSLVFKEAQREHTHQHCECVWAVWRCPDRKWTSQSHCSLFSPHSHKYNLCTVPLPPVSAFLIVSVGVWSRFIKPQDEDIFGSSSLNSYGCILASDCVTPGEFAYNRAHSCLSIAFARNCAVRSVSVSGKSLVLFILS